MRVEFGHKGVQRPDGSKVDSWFGFTCGHCGRQVAGLVLALARDIETGATVNRWLQCPHCHLPSAECLGTVFPSAPFGAHLEGLPKEVEDAYEEARRCYSVSAFTGAELLCRKVLMHVACDKGAKEGETFASYIDHLCNQGYVTPSMKEWVSLIKNHGNASTHRLSPPDRGRAEGTLMFTVQLLRTVYEMASVARKFAKSP